MLDETAKRKIMEATIEEVNDKGLQFTMDDIAKRLKISKKTIYKHFSDKEKLCIDTVDYCFEQIKRSEKSIFENETFTLEEKIKKVLIALPDHYGDMDFRKISGGREKYPTIYHEIEKRLMNGWEPTIALLEEGIQTGLLKEFSIPVFKCMVEASINLFLNGEELLTQGIGYEEALNAMLDILWDGIKK